MRRAAMMRRSGEKQGGMVIDHGERGVRVYAELERVSRKVDIHLVLVPGQR